MRFCLKQYHRRSFVAGWHDMYSCITIVILYIRNMTFKVDSASNIELLSERHNFLFVLIGAKTPQYYKTGRRNTFMYVCKNMESIKYPLRKTDSSYK